MSSLRAKQHMPRLQSGGAFCQGEPYLRAFRAPLGRFVFAPAGDAIRKCSNFLPPFIAAVNHRGFNPRPAQVSAGLSGLRYFGATAPPRRAPIPRDPSDRTRESLLNSDCSMWRSLATLDARTASSCFLRSISLLIDIDFRANYSSPPGVRCFGVASCDATPPRRILVL